jgi:hypothetical protein
MVTPSIIVWRFCCFVVWRDVWKFCSNLPSPPSPVCTTCLIYFINLGFIDRMIYEVCPKRIQPHLISREPVAWPWWNLAASQRRPFCASVKSHSSVWLVSRQWDAVDLACVCATVGFTMTERVDQRICIKFCFKLGHSSAETIPMIKKGFGDDSMSEAQIKLWYSRKWFLLSVPWTQQPTRHVLPYAGSLCDKCVVLKERVKDTPCVFRGVNYKRKYCREVSAY